MRFRVLRHNLESSFWFLPLLWVIGLSGLALVLITLDRQLSTREIYLELPYLLLAEVAGARTLLGAIASALLTVATLAFSIIMLGVVQTSNAYSPRILDEYLSDPMNQHVLGIFLGTFLYTLFVLREVRGTVEADYIPPLSVAGALVFIFIATLAFIYFLGHVAHSIKVSDIIKRIETETKEVMEVVFPEDMGRPWPAEQPPEMPKETPGTIVATRDGYVAAIVSDKLLTAVTRAGALVQLEITVGDHVLRNTPLATVWPADKTDSLTKLVQATIVLQDERTLLQDFLYGAQQLDEMAIRALSPAINDPATAVNCIDGLASIVVELAHHPPVSPYRCDSTGKLRVIAPGQTFAALLDVAFNQIRHYGASDPVVMSHLLRVYRQIGYAVSQPAERAALWEHVRQLAWSANANLRAPFEREAVNQSLREAARVLGHDPTPLLLNPTDQPHPHLTGE
ncbi:MAG: DUF2254 domain-containing protein [Chloroflexota bacterium]|nr:DUF2254 domain-containing protein [Chloroflexota bacterium]